MAATVTEVEVKFYVQRLSDLPRRLQELGCQILHGRVHESNLRFDTPDRLLAREGRALRLRQDAATTLTYKGPSEFQDGIRIRSELEVGVADPALTRQLLEALGYVVTFAYEKYRTTFGLDDAEIMLDELPYGDFAEIEGDPEAIRDLAAKLNLKWERAILESYLGLFENARRSMGLAFGDLTFENFQGIAIGPADLGVLPADSQGPIVLR